MVPSFVHYLEVLEGSDGDKLPGLCMTYYYLVFKHRNFSSFTVLLGLQAFLFLFVV